MVGAVVLAVLAVQHVGRATGGRQGLGQDTQAHLCGEWVERWVEGWVERWVERRAINMKKG